jgi:hypothetical protein
MTFNWRDRLVVLGGNVLHQLFDGGGGCVFSFGVLAGRAGVSIPCGWFWREL